MINLVYSYGSIGSEWWELDLNRVYNVRSRILESKDDVYLALGIL